MKTGADKFFNILCWCWLGVLIFGVNFTLDFIGPGMLIFAVVFFCLVDMVLPKFGVLVKLLISLLMIHRTFYVGSFFSQRWLSWLFSDLRQDWATLLSRGWVSPSPVTGMVITLLVLVILQSLYFTFISKRRGVIWLLFAGATLLTGASLWYGQGTAWFVVLYVVIGLLIMSTTRLQIKYTFPMHRWLSILMVWVLCLTSVAWALPAGNLDLVEWYESVQETWDRIRSRPGDDDDDGSDSRPATARVGYSAYDGELGGPLQNDYTQVMLVQSPEPVYLRGESKYHYTGRGWRNNYNSVVNVEDIAPRYIQGDEVEITINVIDGALGRVLFVPRYPLDFSFSSRNSVTVMSDSSSNFQVPGGYGDYEFRANSSLREGDSYTMTVLLPFDNQDELRQLRSNRAGGDTRYLQLHSGTPERVYELAQEITAQADNDYDRAVALVNYLRSNFRYSLETEPPPRGHDFVDWFLFEQDRGYCVHFSTAFVIMARSQGLNARWVKGFSSGYSDGEGGYRILNSNAHAWPEVWFEGYGWVPFEPTAGFGDRPTTERPDRPDTDRPEPTEPDDNRLDPDVDEGTGEDVGAETSSRNWLYGLGGMLVLLGTIGYVFVGKKSSTPSSLVIAYAKLQKRLRLFGWQRYCWETPREHMLRVRGLIPQGAGFSNFIASVEHALYSARGQDPVDGFIGNKLSLYRLAIHKLKTRKNKI